MKTIAEKIVDGIQKFYTTFISQRVLTTPEEVQANTNEKNLASAVVVGELYNNLMQQPEWNYDSTGKITGYKTPGGADTVFPFSSVKSETNIAIAANGKIKINTGFKPKCICLYTKDTLFPAVYIFNRNISDTSQMYIWAQDGFQNGGVNFSLPIDSSRGFYDITDDGFSFANDGRTATLHYFAIG